ncbi:MAG: cupin domain-containing protein [Chloroflexi bacterium]|nr:cupin domain-containing protein [Chloroflexota bacterium]
MVELLADWGGSHGVPDPRRRTTWDDWKKVSRELDDRWRDLLARPRVIKKSDIVAEGEGTFARAADNEKFGLKTLKAFFEDLLPGFVGLRHGHMNEAVFYILKGRGYEVHDGEKFEWEAGDVVIVPTGAVHCHFNPDPEESAQALVLNPKPVFISANLTAQRLVHLPDEVEQRSLGPDTPNSRGGEHTTVELLADWGGSHGVPDPRRRTTWDDWKKVSRELDDRWRDLLARPRVIKKSEVPCEGEGTFVRAADNEKFGLKTLKAHFTDLAPGFVGLRHGHMNEAVFYILKGRGYEVHDGEKFEWEAGDVVIVPTAAVHCHFNADPKEGAQALAFNPKPVFIGANLMAQRLVHLPEEVKRQD